MDRIALFLAALVMLAIGSAMAVYEWSRIKTKRPLFGGRPLLTLYWCAYLALLVLALTTGLAAAVRG